MRTSVDENPPCAYLQTITVAKGIYRFQYSVFHGQTTYPLTMSEEAREKQNIYHDMTEHADDYDFSEYPRNHPLFSMINKTVIGRVCRCSAKMLLHTLPWFR